MNNDPNHAIDPTPYDRNEPIKPIVHDAAPSVVMVTPSVLMTTPSVVVMTPDMQAATVKAAFAQPFDELGYLRAKLTEATEIAKRLEAELAAAIRDRNDAQRASAGLYHAILDRLRAHFPADSRDLDWDVLPSTVAGLARERDEARAERDRLAMALRCERGEWAPDAPEGAGWTWRPEDWEWTGVAGARSEDGEPTNLYVRHRAYWGDEDDQDDNAWTWLVVETIGMGDEGDALASGTAPTALEAIEACDAAIREVRGE